MVESCGWLKRCSNLKGTSNSLHAAKTIALVWRRGGYRRRAERNPKSKRRVYRLPPPALSPSRNSQETSRAPAGHWKSTSPTALSKPKYILIEIYIYRTTGY